jgi:hypothetical protein
MNRYLTTPARTFDKMCHCTSLTLDSCKPELPSPRGK